MRIIPAIDIIEGKCVRLTKGDYSSKKIYNENPVEVAKQFEAAGIRYLHLVDLDGAKSEQIVNYKVLEKIANQTELSIDFGGGVKSDKDAEIAFSSGANQITGGSIAVNKPDIFLAWLQKYGSKKIILGADYKNRKIATNGWLETSETDLFDFLKQYEKQGIEYTICTDIDKDGMLQGVSETIYKEIIRQTDLKLIASGGISNIKDLEKLKAMKCEGAILGKAIYEGKILLKQIEALC